MKNDIFKCFSTRMAAELSDNYGFPLLRKYWSDVYESMVYEFEWTGELEQAKQTYLKQYNEYKRNNIK